MAWLSPNRHGYLRICFRWKTIECKEGTKLKDTPANRKILQQKLDQIQYEIDRSVFEYRRHFPNGTKVHLFETGAEGRAQSAMMPFGQYAAQWLEANAYALTPATYRSYRTVIHTHVVPFFKDVPLGHISDAHLKRLIAYLQGLQGKGGQPMGPKTINNYLGPLKTMLKEAAEKKLLTYDPTVFVKRLRVPKPDIDPFAPQEIAQLLGHLTPHYRTYFHVAFLTGMRPNEQIALKWKHVDFMGRKIAIREGRVRKDEGLPKSQQSIRDIEMLEPVYDLLLRHRAETWLRGDYVFLNQERRPIDINTLRRRIWYPALKRAGLRARPLYQTRHTFATLMLATSENPEWIAGQLGHTSTQMLFQRYTKFIPNVTRRDGTAFLSAHQRWFGSMGEGGAEAVILNDEPTRGGPLGAFCDTFTTPQQ
jgi:integrase